MKNHDLLLFPGFFGVTEQGQLKTLGRGGSDNTAIVSSYALGLKEVRLWKDTERRGKYRNCGQN